MPFTVGHREVRPLTADEVIRMVDAGILGEDERVELLDGVLTRVSPKSPEHARVISRLLEWLVPRAPAGDFEVTVEHPLVVPDPTSLPEPDVLVIPRDPERVGHPTRALFAVEVAVGSHAIDLHRKVALYAAAGVPEYWVVDVPGGRLHVMARPSGEAYCEQRVVDGGAVAPHSVEVEPLDLARLFDGP